MSPKTETKAEREARELEALNEAEFLKAEQERATAVALAPEPEPLPATPIARAHKARDHAKALLASLRPGLRKSATTSQTGETAALAWNTAYRSVDVSVQADGSYAWISRQPAEGVTAPFVVGVATPDHMVGTATVAEAPPPLAPIVSVGSGTVADGATARLITAIRDVIEW